jgi:hypothetical protein
MCVYLCANPRTSEWLNHVTDNEYRVALQLAAVCVVKKLADADETIREEMPTLDAAMMKKLARGSMLRDAWPRAGETSPREPKNALDVLSEAWSRLLVLVGLRR